MKRPFVRKPKRRQHGKNFWDAEYTEGGHLKLSDDVSEDLAKFTRWVQRYYTDQYLAPGASAVDLGCGNGRNLVFLAREFGMRGVGFDISDAAIKLAEKMGEPYDLTVAARSIAGPLPVESDTQAIALDMMTSHFLSATERAFLRDEIHRMLVPGGWLFMKTFLRDGDLHTRRLLADFGTKEDGTYTHPVIGVPEHAYLEEELLDFLSERFEVCKVYRSHKHVSKGKARKRRTISVYARKAEF